MKRAWNVLTDDCIRAIQIYTIKKKRDECDNVSLRKIENEKKMQLSKEFFWILSFSIRIRWHLLDFHHFKVHHTEIVLYNRINEVLELNIGHEFNSHHIYQRYFSSYLWRFQFSLTKQTCFQTKIRSTSTMNDAKQSARKVMHFYDNFYCSLFSFKVWKFG